MGRALGRSIEVQTELGEECEGREAGLLDGDCGGSAGRLLVERWLDEGGEEEGLDRDEASVAGATSFTAEEASLLTVASSAKLLEGSAPDLLALVQATCADLADRLKSQLPRRSTEADDPVGQDAAPTAAIAAAKAARDLLGEVEMAFLARDPRKVAPGDLLKEGEIEGEQSDANDSSVTQWFVVSTPKGSRHVGARGRFRGSLPRGRHSWPFGPLAVRPGAASGNSTANASETGSPRDSPPPVDGLGQWLEDARRTCEADPCPLLQPPLKRRLQSTAS